MIKALLSLGVAVLVVSSADAIGPVSGVAPTSISNAGGSVSVDGTGNVSVAPQSGGSVNVATGITYLPAHIDFSTEVSPALSANGHSALAWDGTNMKLSLNGAAYTNILTATTAASTYAPIASPTFTGTVTLPTVATTGAVTNSKAGAATTAAQTLSGAPFAGTGTTSFPLLYVNDSTATASTTLSTAGTYLGVNSHGSGDLMNLLKDGVSRFKVDNAGTIRVGFSNGGSGFAQIEAGDSSHTPYVEWFKPDSTRAGYLGFDASPYTTLTLNTFTVFKVANGVMQPGALTFATLPTAAAGMEAYITDGLAANCGDSACSAWGTTVTAGGGSLKLRIWYNGTNWTLTGK